MPTKEREIKKEAVPYNFLPIRIHLQYNIPQYLIKC